MAMEEHPETIIEEREECMVSPNGDGKPTFRTAHFLKPSSVTSLDRPPPPIFELPSHHSLSFPSKLPLKVSFNGWRYPSPGCKSWFDYLHPKYQSTWKRVGIYEAIMASTYEIRRSDDLIFGVAEKWCSETNTFIFPWGEATITLEDVMVLGGYSVLGDTLSTPLKTTDDEFSIEEKLVEVRLQLSRTKAQKASLSSWIKHFMENDSEFKHEAFLSWWLSRFVFPNNYNVIVKHVFPIAIRLARGKRIALAPAVLASIYRDLSLLKEQIVASTSTTKLEISEENDEGLPTSLLTLWSPFQIVQIWAWERFPALRSQPNSIEYNEPRVARWHKQKSSKLDNVRLSLDSAGECFEWRPFAKHVANWLFPKFYREKEEWVLVDSDFDIEFESFARCLRVCELVGIDCIEQYLPHRVAMQFGMDQDIPGHVARCNESPEIAWKTYSKDLVPNTKLYIPTRIYSPDVTTRYSKWCKQSVLDNVWQQRSSKSSKKMQQSFRKRKGHDDAGVPQGFPPKCNLAGEVDSSEDDELTVAETFRLKRLREKKVDNDALVPPRFRPKNKNNNERGNSTKEDEFTPKELFNFSKNLKSVEKSGNDKCMSDAQVQSLSSSTADNEGVKRMESSMARGETNMSSEAAVAAAAAAAGGLERVGENANVSGSNCAANNGEVGSSAYIDTLEIPGLELEARISSLEKKFAGLKEKRVYIILE